MSIAIVTGEAALPPGRRRLGPALALTAAALLVGGAWLRGLPSFVAWEVARDHQRCFGRRDLPARVWSSDPAEVRDWLESRGTPTPTLPREAGAEGLVGARYCPLADRVAAHVYYGGGGGVVSVFLLSGPARIGDGWTGTARGLHVRLVRAAPRPPRAPRARGRSHAGRGRGERRRRGLDGPRVRRERGRSAGAPRRLGTIGLTGPGPAANLLCLPGGAVAQLGARVNGIHEVAGSIPASSTKSPNEIRGRRTRSQARARESAPSPSCPRVRAPSSRCATSRGSTRWRRVTSWASPRPTRGCSSTASRARGKTGDPEVRPGPSALVNALEGGDGGAARAGHVEVGHHLQA
jgi:hypothetical protein